jgi:hypothetical protein
MLSSKTLEAASTGGEPAPKTLHRPLISRPFAFVVRIRHCARSFLRIGLYLSLFCFVTKGGQKKKGPVHVR